MILLKEYGLRESTAEDGQEGGFVLKCPPNSEASVFKGFSATEYIRKLPGITCPTLFFVGDKSEFM